MKKKKTSKRSRSKFPALEPKYNLKTRYELIDYDYLEKLSDKEKEWLNKFTEEYTNASAGKRPEQKRKQLHKTNKLVKDCFDRNNARNRCVWTKAKAQGKNLSLMDLEPDQYTTDPLDQMIDELDKKKD